MPDMSVPALLPLKTLVESLLFVAEGPVPITTLAKALVVDAE